MRGINMKIYRKQVIVFVLFFMAVLMGIFLLHGDYLNPDNIKMHRQTLMLFIHEHYIQAVLVFILLYLLTALFLPGALALTIAGGIMFGTWPAILYVNIGATIGAVLAFYTSRFAAGDRIQVRYRDQLDRFNREIDKHGYNYLLVLRMLPIFPFFVVNYCAGITRISIKTFIWTTSLGMLPGSIIYSYIGNQLGSINSMAEILSLKIILPLLSPCLHYFQSLFITWDHCEKGIFRMSPVCPPLLRLPYRGFLIISGILSLSIGSFSPQRSQQARQPLAAGCPLCNGFTSFVAARHSMQQPQDTFFLLISVVYWAKAFPSLPAASAKGTISIMANRHATRDADKVFIIPPWMKLAN